MVKCDEVREAGASSGKDYNSKEFGFYGNGNGKSSEASHLPSHHLDDDFTLLLQKAKGEEEQGKKI